MRAFLLSLPDKLQPVLIIVATLIFAFISATLSSQFFDQKQLAMNTDLISIVYEVMGTIYAILLTFTLWGVWQAFMKAGASVENEAYALLDLIHMENSSGNKNNKLHSAALNYATSVVTQEWPALKNYTSAMINLQESTHSAAVEIIAIVESANSSNQRETVTFSQALKLLARWLDARRTRILIARGNSAKSLWPLLLTGAFVLFAFHGLFVMRTLSIWIMLLFGTALVIGVTFYLIFSLDCPFAGSPCVDPEPFEWVIGYLQDYK